MDLLRWICQNVTTEVWICWDRFAAMALLRWICWDGSAEMALLRRRKICWDGIWWGRSLEMYLQRWHCWGGSVEIHRSAEMLLLKSIFWDGSSGLLGWICWGGSAEEPLLEWLRGGGSAKMGLVAQDYWDETAETGLRVLWLICYRNMLRQDS
jgi:hypothetical protein